MDENVFMIVTTLAQYLLVAAAVGAIFGIQLARANNMPKRLGALRGGSFGFVAGLFIVGTVTTFLSYF